MPLPVETITFQGPCYLIYSLNPILSHASLKLNSLTNDGSVTTVFLNSETFTRVEGVAFSVTIVPEAGQPRDFPVDGYYNVGPNAWGILQPVDGGISYALQMTQNGKDIAATFKNPTPTPSGAAPTTLPPTPSVLIRDGSVNNGVSDESLLNVTYQLIGGPTHNTPPVPTGQETATNFSARIIQFQLRLTANAVSWYPVENVVMDKGMSLVVVGDYSAPSLAIMVPTGPVKMVALTKVIPESS